MTELTYPVDNLVVGGDIRVDKITLKEGQNLSRGAVLGKITKEASVQADAGNGGNGTVDNITLTKRTKYGDYVLKCTSFAAGAATFDLIDPDGLKINGSLQSGAVENEAKQLNLLITNGSSDFSAGDEFVITIAKPAVTKHVLAVEAAVDGSDKADVILFADTDASAGDVDTSAYINLEANKHALIFGAGHSADTVFDDLRAGGIILHNAQKA